MLETNEEVSFSQDIESQKERARLYLQSGIRSGDLPLTTLNRIERIVNSLFIPDIFYHGDLIYERKTRRLIITAREREHILSAAHSSLFLPMIKQAGEIVHYKTLKRSMEKENFTNKQECLKVYISTLRKILDDPKSKCSYIETIYGTGHILYGTQTAKILYRS